MKFFATTLAFYLLLGSFIPRTDFSQLLHLKDLADHFQQHLNNGKSSGLHEFLCTHLIHAEGHDHGQDEQECPMPCHCPTVSAPVLMAVTEPHLPLMRKMEELALSSPAYLDLFHLDEYVFVIDQPPAA